MTRLADAGPDLERLLSSGGLPDPRYGVADIRCQTVRVAMRDGTGLATDVYLPPDLPAPVVVMRTPYGRAVDDNGLVGALMALARRGFAVVSQDCRGTGDSDPDTWDYYVFEAEDGFDFIEWVRSQDWCGDFIGSFGASYVAQTQWCMATHPAMSAIAPAVSGLGIAVNSANLYMFLNVYGRSVGKGAGRTTIPMKNAERHFEAETMAGGMFNEPLQSPLPTSVLARFPALRDLSPQEGRTRLWRHYCAMPCAERAAFIKETLGTGSVGVMDIEWGMRGLFANRVAHDAFALPGADARETLRAIHAPPLLRTGWYDWGLNDALATWELVRREGRPEIARRARMIITPHAHNMPGYREGSEHHPELLRLPNALNTTGLLLKWCSAVREGRLDAWPVVIYYLMGANEWRAATDWPIPGAEEKRFYLCGEGALTADPPAASLPPDCFTYDPADPTPTVGGSIVSYLYTPGGVDVSAVQERPDVLTYTTQPLAHDLDLVGPLRMILFASSSAVDTDFVARLSDVFPDGRAIQIQSGILRARHRDHPQEPSLLVPGEVYRLEIDMWATANRFRAGHRLRIDISCADFPRFDRNANLGGMPGEPIPATQTIHHDSRNPSHLVAFVLPQERP